MATPPVRFSQLRWLHNAACALGIMGGGVVMLLGLAGFGRSSDLWMVLAGAFAVLLTVAVMTLMPLLVKMEATFARELGEIRDLREHLERHLAQLQSIAENSRISDSAKALAHRHQEAEALRAAIREEITQKNWEAALNLIEEVEDRFGFRQEAESLREELDDARREAIQSKLAEAIERIERQFAAHDWGRAQSEIDRLSAALPGDAKVLSLQDRLKAMREQHKNELKLAWDEAVRRSDTDHAIEVLRELDQYLSPAEAHALQASARHVFKEKLLQLGVQFRFAVTEKRWQDALTIGLELTRDFPNARMAAEVREVMGTIRERAKQVSGSELPAEPTPT